MNTNDKMTFLICNYLPKKKYFGKEIEIEYPSAIIDIYYIIVFKLSKKIILFISHFVCCFKCNFTG